MSPAQPTRNTSYSTPSEAMRPLATNVDCCNHAYRGALVSNRGAERK